jgi:hypothetical protein
VAERLMAAVLKTANGESRSWVQIPPLPPFLNELATFVRSAYWRRRATLVRAAVRCKPESPARFRE